MLVSLSAVPILTEKQLSYLLTAINDRAINANTTAMNVVAAGSREEAQHMKEIAQSTRVDSQAMKLIALLTMLYLPATFVAVCTYLPYLHKPKSPLSNPCRGRH